MDEVEYEEEGLAESLLDENAIASLPRACVRACVRPTGAVCPTLIHCFILHRCMYRTRDVLAGGNKGEWH